MSLILIRGLPGSGKSTLAKSLLASSSTYAKHFEADQYFMEDGEYNFNVDHLYLAHRWCQDKTREALGSGEYSVIVSNTFTTVKELKPYFKIAAEFGRVPQVILCQGSWENVHNVPTETLVKMKNRFEYDISHLFETLGK